MRWATLAGLLAAVFGCRASPGGRSPADRGPSAGAAGEGVTVVEFDVRLERPWVKTYGGPVRHDLGVVERDISKRLSASGLAHDPALSRVARELARVAPDRNNVPVALVDLLMAWSGLADPSPRLVVVEVPEDRDDCAARLSPSCEEPIRSLLEELEQRAEQGSRIYGIGVAQPRPGTTRMILAVLERAVRLAPIPVVVRSDGSVTVKGELLGGRTRPSLELTDTAGHWSALPVQVQAGAGFSGRFACEGRAGPHQLEVLAEGSHGPEVAANFPIYCGVEPPTELTLGIETLDPSASAADLESASFRYLNAERSRRGLAELAWDDRVAAVARAHSLDMYEHGFVGHISPTTSDVGARFAASGLSGAVIRENVARGYGPKGIHESLMNSPGHRVNALADDVTRVGIGIVIGKPETEVAGAPRPLFATQNFVRPLMAPEGDLSAALREEVARRHAGAALVAWDQALTELALELARADARGRFDAARKRLDRRISSLGARAVSLHRARTRDFAALAGLELWTLPSAVALGAAVARDGSEFVLVVLVSER